MALLASLALGVMAYRCGEDFLEPADTADARAVLDRAVELTGQRDFTGVCRLAGTSAPMGACREAVQRLGDTSPGAPAVIRERVERGLPERGIPPGRILELCTVVDGRPVYSEFAVLTMKDGTFRVPQPAYWSGYTHGTPGVDGAAVVDTANENSEQRSARRCGA